MYEVYIFVFIAILISPVSIIPLTVGVMLEKTALKERKTPWRLTMVILGAILLIVGIFSHVKVIPWEFLKYQINRTELLTLDAVPVTVTRFLLSDFKTAGAALIIEELCIWLATMTPEKMMVNYEKNRATKRQKIKPIDYVPKRSQAIFGVSGAGKSAFIGKSIDAILAEQPDAFCMVVDGKGSIEQYSLLYSMKIVAAKHNRKLYVVNGTSNNELSMCTYDFLDGIKASDAAKDLIMSLVDNPDITASANSKHYMAMTESYILEIIEFMFRHDIDVTLSNVLKILEPEKLEAIMEQLSVDIDEREEMNNFAKRNWSDVAANVTKLKMFLNGQGREIFTGSKERFNLRKAYLEKALVVVLADEMSMPSLAEKLVQLVSMDLRNLVAERLTGRMDMNQKVFVYYDEFSSYTSSLPLIKSLYARARSADVVMTLATQSCSDIIGLGGGWFDSLCDTADRFIFFRQHSAEASEAAAALFGTELHLTQTARSSDQMLTGENSNTIDREYRVHPDVIRELQANYGILLDKQANDIKFFKNDFLEGESNE